MNVLVYLERGSLELTPHQKGELPNRTVLLVLPLCFPMLLLLLRCEPSTPFWPAGSATGLTGETEPPRKLITSGAEVFPGGAATGVLGGEPICWPLGGLWELRPLTGIVSGVTTPLLLNAEPLKSKFMHALI
jgi:hypothetical protein